MSGHIPADRRNVVRKTLEHIDLGTVAYDEALSLQYELVERRRSEEIPDTLLLLEHPPVITMGKRASRDDILTDDATLTEAGATVEVINRGGEVTYHGPGQLVGYIIANLYDHDRKLRKFIENLEEVFVRLLASDYDIGAGRDAEHRGVWVGEEKITAIGIAVKNKVTMHGFAFNVNTDLSHFDWIIPCGIRDRGQTSLEKLTGGPVEMAAVKRQVAKRFGEVFGYAEVVAGSLSPPSAGRHSR